MLRVLLPLTSARAAHERVLCCMLARARALCPGLSACVVSTHARALPHAHTRACCFISTQTRAASSHTRARCLHTRISTDTRADAWWKKAMRVAETA
eukprot:1272517-Rhodomonas_salina.1